MTLYFSSLPYVLGVEIRTTRLARVTQGDSEMSFTGKMKSRATPGTLTSDLLFEGRTYDSDFQNSTVSGFQQNGYTI
jgi:hypothetical protein